MRQQLDLNGIWRFCPDFLAEGERFGFQQPDWDDRLWREAELPCALDAVCPGLESDQVRVWFRRAFTLPTDWMGRRLAIHFEGANDHVRVWLNGLLLGANDDPFLPFEFDFSPDVHPDGRHVLAVAVDREPRPDDVPGAHTGWRRQMGILRDVRVTASDFLRVEGVRIEADPADGTLRVQARIVNSRSRPVQARAAAEIADPDGAGLRQIDLGEVRLAAGGEATLSGDAHVAACRPWSPADPALYRARVVLREEGREVDCCERSFDFRRLEARPDGLRLNGERLFLTGFNRHEDSPRTGLAEDREMTRRDLEQMKASGANFVRLCHYPHASTELDVCDALGLIVLSEIPLYFWNNADSGRQNQEARAHRGARQLERMITRDAHHASILFWSVSNETNETFPEVAASNQTLVEQAHRLDPTRLAVHVSNRWKTHPIFDADDVICVNAYPGLDSRICGRGPDYDVSRATENWREELARLHARYPAKPILIMEFGAASIEGTTGHFYGEDRHAAILQAEFAAFDAPYICGATVWCWADHPWPPGRFFGGMPDSPYGLLTRDRRPKAAFHAVRRMFHERQGQPEPVQPPSPTRLLMVRRNLDNLPEPCFPEGCGIRGMRPDDIGLWTDIQTDAEPILRITPDLFRCEFGHDPQAWGRRCFILTDPRGLGIGTISAWYDRDFRGADAGRIHWLSVRRTWQGQGLGRAGLAHAMRVLAQWHDRAYLVTSTERLGAINLYRDFGFEPDEPGSQVGVP
jgi:beta-glucuronidase